MNSCALLLLATLAAPPAAGTFVVRERLVPLRAAMTSGLRVDLGEGDLVLAKGSCSIAPQAQAEALAAFERRLGEPHGVDSIDVNGDGLCDLVVGYEPLSGDARSTISELYVVPGVAGGGLARVEFLRSSGDGAEPLVVYARGSQVPFLVTSTRDGFAHVLRWDPSARSSRKSPFRALGLEVGALVRQSEDDPDARVVRSFVAHQRLRAGIAHLQGERYALAVATLHEAANIDPSSPEVSYHLGVAKYSAGVFADAPGERGASWYFSKAIEQGIAAPGGARYNPALAAAAHHNLGRALEASGDANGAVRSYRAYLALGGSANRPEIAARVERLSRPSPVLEAPTLSQSMVEQALLGSRIGQADALRVNPRFRREQLKTVRELPLLQVLQPDEVETKVRRLEKSALIRGDVIEESQRQGVRLQGVDLEALVKQKIATPEARIDAMVKGAGQPRPERRAPPGPGR